MSTHAEILVVGSGVTISKHHDGRPDGPGGILACLVPAVRDHYAACGHGPNSLVSAIDFALRKRLDRDRRRFVRDMRRQGIKPRDTSQDDVDEIEIGAYVDGRFRLSGARFLYTVRVPIANESLRSLCGRVTTDHPLVEVFTPNDAFRLQGITTLDNVQHYTAVPVEPQPVVKKVARR